MTYSVFVYGSLMFHSVYAEVTGIRAEMVEAILNGYRRYAVQDPDASPYPAIIKEAGHMVIGKLIREVSDQTLVMLDEFEETSSARYERISVKVKVEKEGLIEAFTYVAGSQLRPYLHGAWNPKEFEAYEKADGV